MAARLPLTRMLVAATRWYYFRIVARGIPILLLLKFIVLLLMITNRFVNFSHKKLNLKTHVI
jgi:hypothetical protein